MVHRVACVQLRLTGTVVACIIMDLVLNWFVGSNACANYSLTWYGTPSLVLAIAFVGWLVLYTTTPRRQRSKSKYEVLFPKHQICFFMSCVCLRAQSACLRSQQSAYIVEGTPTCEHPSSPMHRTH